MLDTLKGLALKQVLKGPREMEKVQPVILQCLSMCAFYFLLFVPYKWKIGSEVNAWIFK